MKISLNDRSTRELTQIMEILGHRSPTHSVQTMITSLHKSLIPAVEEPNDSRSHHSR